MDCGYHCTQLSAHTFISREWQCVRACTHSPMLAHTLAHACTPPTHTHACTRTHTHSCMLTHTHTHAQRMARASCEPLSTSTATRCTSCCSASAAPNHLTTLSSCECVCVCVCGRERGREPGDVCVCACAGGEERVGWLCVNSALTALCGLLPTHTQATGCSQEHRVRVNQLRGHDSLGGVQAVHVCAQDAAAQPSEGHCPCPCC